LLKHDRHVLAHIDIQQWNLQCVHARLGP
jgi:hypothetical protein